MNTTKLTERKETKELVNIELLEKEVRKLAGEPCNSVPISKIDNLLNTYNIKSHQIIKFSIKVEHNLCYLFFTLNGVSYYALGQGGYEEYITFINEPPYECEVFSVFTNNLLEIINEHNEELVNELNKVALHIKNINFSSKS
ncbi:hypothetical protein ABEX78_23390 [Priestia megaterium]